MEVKTVTNIVFGLIQSSLLNCPVISCLRNAGIFIVVNDYFQSSLISNFQSPEDSLSFDFTTSAMPETLSINSMVEILTEGSVFKLSPSSV